MSEDWLKKQLEPLSEDDLESAKRSIEEEGYLTAVSEKIGTALEKATQQKQSVLTVPWEDIANQPLNEEGREKVRSVVTSLARAGAWNVETNEEGITFSQQSN